MVARTSSTARLMKRRRLARKVGVRWACGTYIWTRWTTCCARAAGGENGLFNVAPSTCAGSVVLKALPVILITTGIFPPKTKGRSQIRSTGIAAAIQRRESVMMKRVKADPNASAGKTSQHQLSRYGHGPSGG